MVSTNNLKQIAIAMHRYHQDHGCFPPAVVSNGAGQPLYSWRVLLLPYLEEAKLYHDFHLNEAWDSAHNKGLLARMPKVYKPPVGAGTGAPPHSTYYQVFVGEGAAFANSKSWSMADFADLHLTCFAVEAGSPVAWSQPKDLMYAEDQPLPELGGIFRGGSRFSGLAKEAGFSVAFADGSVRWFKPLRSAEEQGQFRRLIVRRGNKTETELLP